MQIQITKNKCPICGQEKEVSRDGWLVNSIIKGKREVRYFEWHHIVGHMNGEKMCVGSGASPSGLKS